MIASLINHTSCISQKEVQLLYNMHNIPTEDQWNPLTFLSKYAKIDIDEVLLNIEMTKREEALKLHKFEITEPKKPGDRYSTYIPDETKPNGRRKVQKANYDDLIKVLVEEYLDKKNKVNTVQVYFNKWFENRKLSKVSRKTLQTDLYYFNKYYKNNSVEIIDIPIKALTKSSLETWANSTIREFNLTKKEYCNMKKILVDILELAIDDNLIRENPYNRVKITADFTDPNFKPDTETVFNDEELLEIAKLALADFKEHPTETAPLAVLFDTQCGLRNGELSALQWNDVSGDYLNICHQEVVNMVEQPDGTYKKCGYQIVEYAKKHRKRRIYLTPYAKQLLDIVKQVSENNGYNSKFIFCGINGRATTRAITYRLEKYCRQLNIPIKRTHAVRRTVATLMSNNPDISLSAIQNTLGHRDKEMTLKYIRNTHVADSENSAITQSLCNIGTVLNRSQAV